MTTAQELLQSIAALQNLRNIFRGAEQIERILAQVQAADQLASERTAQLAALDKIVAERREEIVRAEQMVQAFKREGADVLASAQAAVTKLESDAAAKRKAQADKFAAEFEKALANAEDVKKTFAAEVTAVTAKRDVLAEEVARLETIVSELRTKLAGV